MRTLGIVFAGFLVAALGSGIARATTTTTHLVESGTGADVDVNYNSPDFCTGISLTLSPVSSVTRGKNGGTSAGMQVELFFDNFCTGEFEFAFTTLDLTNEFQTGPGNNTATLIGTFPIQTFDFDGNTFNRVIVANLQLQATSGDTTSSMTKSRFDSGSGFRTVSSGHSVSNGANVTGQVSIDGLALLPSGSTMGDIQTSMNVSVDIFQN